MLSGGLLAQAGGCAERRLGASEDVRIAREPNGAGGTRRIRAAWVGRGDWDDLEAAMEAGMSKGEVAVTKEIRGEREWTWELISIEDRVGSARATRQAGQPIDASGSEEIELEVAFPMDSGRVIAEEVVRAMAGRLRQLKGVGAAPID